MTTEITKQLLRELRTELDAVIASVGQKHGLTLRCGNASFSATNATMKLEITLPGAATRRDEALALDMAVCFRVEVGEHVPGATPETVFRVRDQECKLVGFNARCRQYPWLMVRLRDGKRFRTNSFAVRLHMKEALAKATPTTKPNLWNRDAD